jgi:hypothetical protein
MRIPLTRDEQSSGGRAERAGAKAKAKRGAAKAPRTNAERAMAHIRAAKKDQREVSDPVERVRLLLAEANVLALLELADAISGDANGGGEAPGVESPPE